uniref:Uncharacterized protein n=1 Tax=Trichuris muris TaxID=70415 RepID=A0A5S6QY63_TRIMR
MVLPLFEAIVRCGSEVKYRRHNGTTIHVTTEEATAGRREEGRLQRRSGHNDMLISLGAPQRGPPRRRVLARLPDGICLAHSGASVLFETVVLAAQIFKSRQNTEQLTRSESSASNLSSSSAEKKGHALATVDGCPNGGWHRCSLCTANPSAGLIGCASSPLIYAERGRTFVRRPARVIFAANRLKRSSCPAASSTERMGAQWYGRRDCR